MVTGLMARDYDASSMLLRLLLVFLYIYYPVGMYTYVSAFAFLLVCIWYLLVVLVYTVSSFTVCHGGGPNLQGPEFTQRIVGEPWPPPPPPPSQDTMKMD